MKLPETYILGKFYAYSGEPEFKKYDNTYNACCPICREGKSWGKKKRLYYYPLTGSFFCFNCSRSWNAFNWIKEVCGLSYDEIKSEIIENKSGFDITDHINFEKKSKKLLPDLPYDSINLFDDTQVNFYKNHKFFQKALDYIKSRKLDVAINKSPYLYISLTDFFHKERLCIPFQDRNKKILFYQTRCLDETNPKYLGKVGYDKTLFGIDRVDQDLDYIFIFEGPIDAMFVKNGVAAAGLTLNGTQTSQLMEFPFHKKIWVLDNPKYDSTAKKKTKDFIERGYSVFKWPLNWEYKDFNEMAIKENLNEISFDLLTNSLY